MSIFRMRMLLGIVAVVVLCGGSGRAQTANSRYTISGGTVLDTKTNLTWQQTGSTVTYMWANAPAYCSGMGSGWRLPTVRELQTLVNYGRTAAPLIDTVAFPGTQSNGYWSSTAEAASPSTYAWLVFFSDGSTFSNFMTGGCYVRCVR